MRPSRTPTAAQPRLVAVWRQDGRLVEWFDAPLVKPFIIPPGPDADGGKRRLARDARALGLEVEWAGERTAAPCPTVQPPCAVQRRSLPEAPLLRLRASAFRNGAAVICTTDRAAA